MTSGPADPDARTLQKLVDDVSDLLSAPAVLEDLGFALVAYGSQSPEGVDQIRAATILRKTATAGVRTYFLDHGIASAAGPVRIPADADRQIAARICIPARSGGRTHGYLWVVEPAAGVPDQALALSGALAARAGELLARRAGAVDERTGLHEDLFGTDPVRRARAWSRLGDLGELGSGEALVVVVVRGPDGSARHRVLPVPELNPAELTGAQVAARRTARRLAPGAVAGVSDLWTPPVHPGGSVGPEGARSRVGSEGPAGAVAPAGPGGGPGLAVAVARALDEAARQATTAAVVALARPHLGPVLTWEHLGFYRVAAQGPAALRALIGGGPADRLRTRADADLVRTALVWLDQGGNAARTAATLSVHRQTLYYRLERIGQLGGVDLGDGEARLGLHVGLALAEVLARMEMPS